MESEAFHGEQAREHFCRNSFTLEWHGPLQGLQELRMHVLQQQGLLQITYEFEGQIQAAGAVIPLMFGDGEQQAEITCSANRVRTEFRGAYAESKLVDSIGRVHVQDGTVASRNGLLRFARMEVPGSRTLTFTVELGASTGKA